MKGAAPGLLPPALSLLGGQDRCNRGSCGGQVYGVTEARSGGTPRWAGAQDQQSQTTSPQPFLCIALVSVHETFQRLLGIVSSFFNGNVNSLTSSIHFFKSILTYPDGTYVKEPGKSLVGPLLPLVKVVDTQDISHANNFGFVL